MFKLKFKQNLRIMAVLLTAVILLISLFYGGVATASAETSVDYTDVLEDLQKDESFKISNYPELQPEDEDYYSLQVIQVAETTGGELLIYVYQPSGQNVNLTATYISMSTSIGDSFSPRIYKLRLVSSNGVFYKYVLNEFTVKADAVRYYDIVELFRPFDASIDSGTGNDNTEQGKSIKVAQTWTACTLKGEVTYGMVESEVIEIREENRWDGFIEYSNGFKFYVDKCHSHFIAFSADRPIDKLMEAEVYYVTRSVERTYGYGVQLSERFGEPVEHHEKLSDKEERSTEADGLFAKKYTWQRIESVDYFKEHEDLTSDAEAKLEGKQWVLRFAETSYEVIGDYKTQQRKSIEVSNVTILRLEFETEGVPYNLGVVTDMRMADDKPDNNNTNEFDFSGVTDWLEKIFALVAVILLVVILAAVFPPVFTLLTYLFKGIVWIICLPFRLLAWVFGNH